MKQALLIFSVIALLVGCKKNDPTLSSGDHLIFGHFYGECIGEGCVEIFKLEDGKLYEDTTDDYPSLVVNSFDFEELDNEKYLLATGLFEAIPDELIASPDTTFGCPDCLDQGGLFIEYKSGLTKKKWRVDNISTEVPTYLHEFMGLVKEKIELIND